MLNPELSVVPDPPEGQEMSAMRRVLLWGAGILAVLVLIGCGLFLIHLLRLQSLQVLDQFLGFLNERLEFSGRFKVSPNAHAPVALAYDALGIREEDKFQFVRFRFGRTVDII